MKAGRSHNKIYHDLVNMSIFFMFMVGRTAVFDGLGSLRPTERMSGSLAWSQWILWRNAGLERLE
jgi:hypothetical protein